MALKDTNIIYASLKEKMWVQSHAWMDGQVYEPGQILKIVADPLGSMISSSPATEAGHTDPAHYASPLALTLSRFREFRYLGTRVALRPAATTGSVDPAHISMVPGQVNSVDPRDITNQIHYRRWIGDNFHVPQIDPSGNDDVYLLWDSYDLDAAWLADSRFAHAPITDGFDVFVQPLRSTVEMSAAATNSMFGFYSSVCVSPREVPTNYQAPGMVALTGGDVVVDGWMPNPLAGFRYASKHDPNYETGEELMYVSGFNPLFPWFSDLLDLTGAVGVEDLYRMCRERLMAPLMILRIPPAYGTKFYWALYMRHYFAARKPFYVCGNWVAGKVSRMVPSDPSQWSSPLRVLQECDQDPDGIDYHVSQMAAPDPYGNDMAVRVVTMRDGDVVDGYFAPSVDGYGLATEVPLEITDIDKYGRILSDDERARMADPSPSVSPSAKPEQPPKVGVGDVHK